MSIWQAPFRPPPLRSNAVVRVHRRYSDGDGESYVPQPISPPDIIPLQRGFWAAYGKQTIGAAVVCVLSLLFMWGSWVAWRDAPYEYDGVRWIISMEDNLWAMESYEIEDKIDRGEVEFWFRVTAPPEPENTTAEFFVYMFGVMALLTLCMPFFFLTRYRRLERAFGGDEMYESAEGVSEPEAADHESPLALASRQPNIGQHLDGTEVGMSAALLAFVAVAQAVSGVLILLGSRPVGGVAPAACWVIFAVGLLLFAVTNLVLFVGTLRHEVGVAQVGFLASLGTFALSFVTVHWMPMAATAVAAGLLYRNHMAFKMMVARVVDPEKRDPLDAYYHNLLQLLVWVMRADGHCDRRELRKIKASCDALRLSSWERDFVLASANVDDRAALKGAAKRYLESAEAAGIPEPGHSLIVVAVAVAGADGVVERQEAEAVRDLAKLVGVDDERVSSLLLEQQLHLEALDTDRARDLLHLPAGASDAEVRAAHQALADELDQSRFAHIGAELSRSLAARRAVLDRARDLLLQSAADR